MATATEKADQRYKLRLRSLKFLSLVDRPAQETAQVLLTKRAGGAAELGISGTAQVVKVSDELGLVFAWAWTGKKDGEDYVDLQGDVVVDDDEMVKAAADFMAGSRAQDVQHDREPDGMVVFAMPMTPDIAKAFGVETKTTGLMVAVKPSADVFAQVKRGELRGISLDGTGVREPMKAAKAYISFYLGDRVRVLRGREHMPEHAGKHGTVMECEGSAHAIQFDGETAAHRWYVASEIAPCDADELAEAHGMADMKRASTHEPMTAAKRAPSNPAPTTEQKTMSTTDIEKKLEDATKRAERAEAIADMTEAQKTYFRALPAADRAALIAKSAVDRRAALEKATEIVYTAADGTVYRAFDDERMVNMAKRTDESEKRATDAELSKRAEPLTKHLGGKKGHLALVKAIESIPDKDERAAAFEALKSGNDSAGRAFVELGVAGGGSADESSAEARLAKMTDDLAAKKGLSFAEAQVELLEKSNEAVALKKQADQERKAARRARA